MPVLIWHVAPWGNVLDLASQKCMGTVPARVHVASKRVTRGLAPLALPPFPHLALAYSPSPLSFSSPFLTLGCLLIGQKGRSKSHLNRTRSLEPQNKMTFELKAKALAFEEVAGLVGRNEKHVWIPVPKGHNQCTSVCSGLCLWDLLCVAVFS